MIENAGKPTHVEAWVDGTTPTKLEIRVYEWNSGTNDWDLADLDFFVTAY